VAAVGSMVGGRGGLEGKTEVTLREAGDPILYYPRIMEVHVPSIGIYIGLLSLFSARTESNGGVLNIGSSLGLVSLYSESSGSVLSIGSSLGLVSLYIQL
jgi:hypothetical protein